jgi:hypothetical protein
MSKYGLNNLPRVPLNVQNPDITKAGPQKNPSYESFGPHERHQTGKYRYQGQDRPNTHMMSTIRRNPDGTLDYEWAKNVITEAIHKLSYPHALLPYERALVTVVFPERFREMEPMQADLMTQFSDTEKRKVRELVEQQLLEEENWNAGYGGGSDGGRGKTRDGYT